MIKKLTIVLLITVSSCNESEIKVGASDSRGNSQDEKECVDFPLEHDTAISVWFHFQRVSMNVISFDDENVLHLKSYVEFTKFENSLEEVLDIQKAAVAEVKATHNGEKLDSWLESQIQAADVLKEFIKLIDGDVTVDENLHRDCGKYMAILETQGYYAKLLRQYREGFNKNLDSSRK